MGSSRRLLRLVRAASVLGLAVSAGAAGAGSDDRAIVARIGGEPVEAEELARFVLNEQGASAVGTDALDHLVEGLLVEIEAKRRNVAIAPSEIDARVQRLDVEFKRQSGGKQSLADYLQAHHIGAAEFRDLTEKSLAAERMMTTDFGLAPGDPVPPEKQSLWYSERKEREGVRKTGLEAGAAARVGPIAITRTQWGLKILQALDAAALEKLFDDFVGMKLVLREADRLKLSVTAGHLQREIDERSQKLAQLMKAKGLPTDGVDYLATLKARGEDPDAVISSDRFRAEILLKELARERFGKDGFRSYYADHRADFDRRFGRKVRLSTIFLRAGARRSAKVPRTWAEAQDELDRVRVRLLGDAGNLVEGFASQARLHSDHASRANGGDLGELGANGLAEIGLDERILDEKERSLVGPIATADGAHLLLVTGKRAASAFEEIAGDVEQAARREVMEGLRKDVAIERNL